MPRTHDIELDALRKAVAALGSQNELSRRSGVPQCNIANYLSGRNKHIRDDVWDKLEPHLRKYMPSAESAAKPAGNELAIKVSPKEHVLVEAFRTLDSAAQSSVLSCLLSGKPVCANSRPSPCPRPYDSPVPPGDSETSGGASAA